MKCPLRKAREKLLNRVERNAETRRKKSNQTSRKMMSIRASEPAAATAGNMTAPTKVSSGPNVVRWTTKVVPPTTVGTSMATRLTKARWKMKSAIKFTVHPPGRCTKAARTKRATKSQIDTIKLEQAEQRASEAGRPVKRFTSPHRPCRRLVTNRKRAKRVPKAIRHPRKSFPPIAPMNRRSIQKVTSTSRPLLVHGPARWKEGEVATKWCPKLCPRTSRQVHVQANHRPGRTTRTAEPVGEVVARTMLPSHLDPVGPAIATRTVHLGPRANRRRLVRSPKSIPSWSSEPEAFSFPILLLLCSFISLVLYCLTDWIVCEYCDL